MYYFNIDPHEKPEVILGKIRGSALTAVWWLHKDSSYLAERVIESGNRHWLKMASDMLKKNFDENTARTDPGFNITVPRFVVLEPKYYYDEPDNIRKIAERVRERFDELKILSEITREKLTWKDIGITIKSLKDLDK